MCLHAYALVSAQECVHAIVGTQTHIDMYIKQKYRINSINVFNLIVADPLDKIKVKLSCAELD